MKFYPYRQDQTVCALCKGSAEEPSLRFECFTLNKKHRYYHLAGAAVHPSCLVDFPGAREFVDFYFVAVLEQFQTSDYWFLITVGDKFTDFMDSQDCTVNPPQYDTKSVVASLLEMGNANLITTEHHLRVTWDSNNEIIEYEMDIADRWEGASLVPLCKPETFLVQWRHLKQRFERVYLADADCCIWALDYFESVYVNQKLGGIQKSLISNA